MWLKSARIPPELEETLQSIPISVDEVTRDRISRHARAREYSWVLIASPDQYICANPQGPPLERQKDRPSCTSRLPILRLDPFLQSYFSEARAVATRTLHPLVIRAEADLLATWLSRDRLTPPYHSREDRLTIFGRVLFFAAIADIRTTRSVALLVFQMLKALKSESLQKDFRNKIGTDLMKVFQWAWGQNITRQLTAFKPRDGGDCRFDAVRNDVLNMTAYAGALSSLGIISQDQMATCVAPLLVQPLTPLRIRGLHLLMLHASPAIARPLAHECLTSIGETLVSYSCSRNPAIGNYLRLWMCEVGRIVDAMLDDAKGKEPCATTLKWDPTLVCESLLRRCDFKDRFDNMKTADKPRFLRTTST